MIDLIHKIEAKINKRIGGCWSWRGKWNGNEPDFRYRSHRIKVREVLYGWVHSCFPPKKVYRTCPNILCVNPLHMSTQEDKRSVVAKLYDDEDHLRLAYDPDTGEIARGFLPPKNTKIVPKKNQEQFWKKEYEELETGKPEDDSEMDLLPETMEIEMESTDQY